MSGPIAIDDQWTSKGIWSIINLKEGNILMSHVQIAKKLGINCAFQDVLAFKQKKIPSEWNNSSLLQITGFCREGTLNNYTNLVHNNPIKIQKAPGS